MQKVTNIIINSDEVLTIDENGRPVFTKNSTGQTTEDYVNNQLNDNVDSIINNAKIDLDFYQKGSKLITIIRKLLIEIPILIGILIIIPFPKIILNYIAISLTITIPFHIILKFIKIYFKQMIKRENECIERLTKYKHNQKIKKENDKEKEKTIEFEKEKKKRLINFEMLRKEYEERNDFYEDSIYNSGEHLQKGKGKVIKIERINRNNVKLS